MHEYKTIRLFVFFFMLIFAVTVYADEAPEFGGPSGSGAQINDDARMESLDRALTPWFSFKTRAQESIGLSFGLDYTTVAMGSTGSLPGKEQGAAAGNFRFYSTWTIFGGKTGNTGSLGFKVESRHVYGTQTTPQMFGLENLGYHGITGGPFGDWDASSFGITNFFWHQKILQGRLSFLVGVIDVTDYIDIYAAINPWSSFLNLAFLTNPTIPAPDQGLGFAIGTFPHDNIYVVAGMADANGKPQQAGFDTFFKTGEYFYHGEIGWVSSQERRYLDNIHVIGWYQDSKSAAGTPAGWGLAFSAAYFFDDKWLPFFRAGYSEGGGALLDISMSTGLAYYFSEKKDAAGLGFHWGSPAVPGYQDQFTTEIFFRFLLAQNLAITPDIQFLLNPAANPDTDFITVFGLRVRLNF